jgi:predicted amidohydrolase YtcJ
VPEVLIYFICKGALGSWGAALLAPYSDKPETSGLMLSTPQALAALVKQFWKDGWQVVRYCHTQLLRDLLNIILHQNIHCIGDRANKVVLDIFEKILEGHGVENLSEWRPRIEHAQILQVSDLERAGRLGGPHSFSMFLYSWD